jgi:uncharacterized membrane protein HdeD (DUF308 family)
MKTIIFGFVLLAFAVMILSSPYWLFREITRRSDEPLPDWMGDARARKERLVLIAGVLAVLAGGVAVAAGLAEQ